MSIVFLLYKVVLDRPLSITSRNITTRWDLFNATVTKSHQKIPQEDHTQLRDVTLSYAAAVDLAITNCRQTLLNTTFRDITLSDLNTEEILATIRP